jgi:hypothetical protein
MSNVGIAAMRAFFFALGFAAVAFILNAFTDANPIVAGEGPAVAAGAAAFEGGFMFALLFIAGLVAWEDKNQFTTMSGVSFGIIVATFYAHGWQGLATPAEVPLFLVVNFWWIIVLLGAVGVLIYLFRGKARGPTPPTGH